MVVQVYVVDKEIENLIFRIRFRYLSQMSQMVGERRISRNCVGILRGFLGSYGRIGTMISQKSVIIRCVADGFVVIYLFIFGVNYFYLRLLFHCKKGRWTERWPWSIPIHLRFAEREAEFVIGGSAYCGTVSRRERSICGILLEFE